MTPQLAVLESPGMGRQPSRHVGNLGDIVGHGHTLTLNCERCLHRSELNLIALIAGHSENYLVRKVVDRAVCSKCGDRDAEVTCTWAWPMRRPIAIRSRSSHESRVIRKTPVRSC